MSSEAYNCVVDGISGRHSSVRMQEREAFSGVEVAVSSVSILGPQKERSWLFWALRGEGAQQKLRSYSRSCGVTVLSAPGSSQRTLTLRTLLQKLARDSVCHVG